jgi:hypothetical protein
MLLAVSRSSLQVSLASLCPCIPLGSRLLIGALFLGMRLLTLCYSSLTYRSRSLNGALNGNVGVIKSIVAEITDPTNLPQVYAYMPASWSTGSTLG